MKEYNYEEWLAGHATRKTMMEKLERSLIPYELFARMPLKNDRQKICGTIEYGTNSYSYQIHYDYTNFGNDIYDVRITIAHLEDKWNNLIPGYNSFKVVIRDDTIITIYADHEDYFQNVIGMFEREDIAALYQHRNAYVHNLLARYILLQLIERHTPNMQMLATISTERYGNVPVIAANANRTEVIMYAFSKRDAIEIAKRFDGLARSLTIVYFLNQDFERDGNSKSYYSDTTQVVSIRSFYTAIELDNVDCRNVEHKVLMLVSLLYEEQLDWERDKISRVALAPPTKAAVESLVKTMKNRRKRKTRPTISPWWNRFFRTLLEDALNVLDETPVNHRDIFHTLCAANMVNAYVNHCNRQRMYSRRQLSRMFEAKQQMFRIICSLTSNPHCTVTVNLTEDPSAYVHIKVNKIEYQFSFRGFNDEQLTQLKNSGIPTNGKYRGISLQAIATALYQYSYLQRWKGLNNMDEMD